jgi:hypothetical protein
MPVLLVLTGGTSSFPVKGVKYLLFSDRAVVKEKRGIIINILNSSKI